MSDDATKLLGKIQRAWDELKSFLVTLTDKQKTTPTDAGGWAIKDHLIHMAVWEDGIDALLKKESRDVRMGLDQVTPKPRRVDALNDVIFRQHRDKTLQEVMETRRAIHNRLTKTIIGLTDEDLTRSIREYDETSGSNQPVMGLIVGNTLAHYRKHLPWIKAIVSEL